MRGWLGTCLGMGLLGIGCFITAGMAAPQTPAPQADMPARIEIDALASFEVQRLVLPDTREQFATTVTLGKTTTLLRAEPYSLRSPDFRLLVQGDDGELHEQARPAPATIRGHLEGVPGSRVAGSLRNGQLSAMVYIPDEGLYNIAPLSDFTSVAAPDEHVIFHHGDVVLPAYACGADDIEQPNWPPGDDSGDGGIAGTGLKICDIACEADGEFYNLNGMSVPNTVFDIENVMNGVESIYEGEVQIGYEVTYIIVWTNPASDPYTGTTVANLLLDEMRANWNSANRDVRRDVAQLFTGRNLNLPVIGVAWLATICDSVIDGHGYSVVESRFTLSMTSRVCLSAHEIGHTWAAQHCDGQSDCAIMCSSLGACGHGCTTFGQIPTNQITNHKNSRTCLSDLADPLSIPFFDDFPSATIDAAKWSYINGATASTDAANEPSGANSLHLDSSGTDPYDNDDVRSNFIRLNATDNITLSYYTEHRATEAGDELIVEYWNNNLTWVEVNRIVADGTTQDNFVFWSHDLPADAAHNEFRVRFHASVDSAGDEWYVDDVLVDGDAAPRYDVTIDAGPFASFVPITVSPPDDFGADDGLTPFVRTYVENTGITLTAPATAGGFDFARWELDGLEATTSRALNFTVTGDVAAEAIYLPEVNLTIDSAPDQGALVLVAPVDNNIQGAGITPFTRLYTLGDDVTLTALPIFNGKDFSHWTVGGSDQPAGQNVVVVEMVGPLTAVANYSDDPCIGFVCADANCNGSVDAEDIDPFFVAIGDAGAYASQFPSCDLLCNCDVNASGGVDSEDIDPFFVAIGVGGCP